MKHTKMILGSFLLVLLIWGYAAWPLPKYTFSGIPAAHHRSELHCARSMIAGDHLQFLYHFWLAKDTFCGSTPLFYNTYEFNTGEDETRKDTANRYYLPFSLMFILGALGGNQALGWNLTGFLSLWVTLVFAWLLAKRYTQNRWAAATCAIISIAFPYRWFTLLGGSPTGLAMMWVPVIYYGLDIVVGERKPWGAVLAGSALCLSEWSDPHVTFFTGMSAPFWCILSYCFHHRDRWLPSAKELREYTLAGSPLLLFGGLMVLQARMIHTGLQATAIGQKARPIIDVAINSPRITDAVSFNYTGAGSQIYIGYLTLLLLGASLLVLLAKGIYQWRNKDHTLDRACIIALLLSLAVVGILMLSLGIHIPGGERTWRLLCTLLPPYGKLRQPAKIFCILPVIIAMAYAFTLPNFVRTLMPIRRARPALWILLATLILVDYAHHTNPSISLLDKKQDAYAAIAKDATAHNRNGHLLAIPLWPGNSHWSSLYQYYVSLYRLRMVNGYRPTPKTEYQEYIQQFESFNKGGYSDAQLDELEGKGIHYLVLHENAFPEKVSPFSVATVLRRLLAHPRIALLAQDGPVWAFKLVPAPQGIYPSPPKWDYDFPSRLWQAERAAYTHAEVLPSPNDTSAHHFLRMTNTTATMTLQKYPLTPLPGLCYMARMRGEGQCKAVLTQKGACVATQQLQLSRNWEWYNITIPEFDGYAETELQLSPLQGTVDTDLVILATDSWPKDGLKEPLVLPAPLFFHAGYTDIETGQVVFDQDREPADYIFYGPKLPLPAGRYRITIDYSSRATPGTLLAHVKARYPSGKVTPSEMVAGKPASFIYDLKTNLRLAFDLGYTRSADLRIKNVTISPEP